jgi:poly-gamma-glutamate capsule biosynthesis protein CapA/YwtB (metallophosphatase superfamily)
VSWSVKEGPAAVTLFLCGDVMTGRGIDQALPHPCDPVLYESWVVDARDYVALAERAHGPLTLPLPCEAIWGDALGELARRQPDARIINLETAVTTSAAPWPMKGIHYRMNPANVLCLTAAATDCCVLANNHVLDWGYDGLRETLQTLHGAGLRTCGAGLTLEDAATPAALEVRDAGRVLVFGLGSPTSGIPESWAATHDRAGVWLLPEPHAKAVPEIARRVREARRPGDVVVVSVHWGGNWGYDVPLWQADLAHALVDEAGVDLVHGHSSHHPKGIEVYRGKLVLYGCGDLLTDYEGIHGHEAFRGDLSLMYFAEIGTLGGDLIGLTMTPTVMKRFCLNPAPAGDARWLAQTLDRESRPWGASVELRGDGQLHLLWS